MLLALLLSLALFALEAMAQVDTGTIAGTVSDASGAVIPNATVTARNVATSAERTAQTNTQGGYNIPALQPGQYEVTVKAPNFAQYNARTTVTVGQHVTLDATLGVSHAETVVEVIGEGGTQVNTQTQELSQIITPQQVAQLPSLTRNPYDFVAVSGNVSGGDRTASGGDQNTTGRGVGYAINGQRTSGTEILLDGVENIDLFTATVGQQIPVDSVQEFRVITSNFDAQYGRASGGVVNVSTKSGTNNFHGSAWEFNRLAAYTANTYDNSSKDLPKGQYTRNQFGYDIGGPIIKNKLFIFQSTEWTRVRSNASLSSYVPTPELLAALPPNVQNFFSTYGANTFNFASTLNAGQVASAVGSTGAFSALPSSLPALGLVNFSAPADAGGGVPTNTYRIIGRIDFNLSDKTQMFFRYALENIDNFIGADFATPYPQYDVGDSSYNQSGLFSISHTFSNSLLANVKLSASRVNFVNTYDKAQQNVPELLITSGASVNGTPVQLPGLFAQFAGAGGLPFGGPQNVFQVAPTVSWTKGRHNLMFGGLYDYQQMNRAFGAYAQGVEELGLSNAQGFDNLALGNLALFQAAVFPENKFPCVRDPNTNQLIATPDCTLTLPTTSPSFSRSYRYNDWAIFAQDSFRMTPRLTLNYGLRYEHYGVQHNVDPNLDSNFYYGSGSDVYEQVRNGSVQTVPNSGVGGLWNPRWGTVAPRVGFAMDLFGDGKTSLRGGFGISYERNFGNVTFNVIQNPPNYASVQLTPGNLGAPIPVTNDNLGPFAGSTGSVPLSPSSLRHVNQDIQVAQTQFWSLAVERELAPQTVFAVEYSGAHGVHLYDIAAFNQLCGGQVYLGDSFANGICTRPNQQYSGINTRGSLGGSRYNALNLRFQSTNLHHTGLSLVANYTWSHSLDDLSSTFSDSTGGASNGIGNLGYLDPRNPGLDWGSSDFDIRHRVSITPIWETPWYRTGKGWKRQLLGGYTLVPVFSARSGTPFSIYDTINSINAGSGFGIPRYTPNGAITSYSVSSSPTATAPNLFTALTLPSGDQAPFDPVLGVSDFGPFPITMSRRNAFRGPGAWTFDLAASKSFALTERVKLEFRAEGFDILNHHNFYVNALNLDVFNYGTNAITVPELKGGLGVNAIGGNHDERRFGQFALRVTF